MWLQKVVTVLQGASRDHVKPVITGNVYELFWVVLIVRYLLKFVAWKKFIFFQNIIEVFAIVGIFEASELLVDGGHGGLNQNDEEFFC